MPQIAQIAETYASQIFWLLITFGLIFFLIGRGMVPKIEATVQSRDSRIAADLRAAEEARAQADATEEAYRARLAETRAESGRVIQAAKDSGARATAARVAEADEGIAARTAEAEARLDEARRSALADVEAVAAEAAREMVAKLAGVEVPPALAQDYVRAAVRNDAHG